MKITALFGFFAVFSAMIMIGGCQPARVEPPSIPQTEAVQSAASSAASSATSSAASSAAPSAAPTHPPTQALAEAATAIPALPAAPTAAATALASTAMPPAASETPQLLKTRALEPGLPAPGIWISRHAKQGSPAWIQFEVYYQDGQAYVDVLEACIDYACDVLGEDMEAKGCTGTRSPKAIPLRSGALQIEFTGLMPDTLTHASKLGTIHAHFPEPEVIAGAWIIPICDLWMPLQVGLNP